MKQIVCNSIEAKRSLYYKISEQIWELAEGSYQEFQSVRILIDALKDEGFEVETGIAGMPTAFRAVYGNNGPVIGYLAEYDALQGLSQEAGNPNKVPVVEGGNGHGCGHNSIGTSCIAAAIAMKDAMKESGMPGTVIVYGCPAEEKGCGKCFMARDGIFDEADIAMAPHPIPNENALISASLLANVQVEYSFTGVSSHAAGTPHLGRSALDAAELMVVGTQFLREHIIPEARIHHAYLDVGGESPNVVQASAKLLFYIRAPKAEQVKEVLARVNEVARGAAIMTGTSVTINHTSGLMDFVANDVLGKVAEESWNEIGKCDFSEKTIEMTKIMAASLGKSEDDVLLNNNIPKYIPTTYVIPGSTDIGDVSYRVPTLFVNFEGVIAGTVGHSWQFVAQAGTEIMHEGMLHAAKVMAYTGMKLLEDSSIIESAKEELHRRTGGKILSLLPENAKPEI